MIAGTIHLEDISMTFHAELGAIVGTSVCGTNEAVMNAAHPIAESAFPFDWPKELRPMP